ncbi:MAG: MBOAT family protein [Gammaproteobacteria bacterium]|nr:MBOAT family protein [Gammaproteobacteria bacterium]
MKIRHGATLPGAHWYNAVPVPLPVKCRPLMLFNSLTFLVFFAVVFSVHQLLPVWTARKCWLLAASYVFYAAWHPPYALILLFSTGLDWWLARRMFRCEVPERRRRWLIVSLLSNLGLLGVFKYGGFLLENFRLLLQGLGVVYAPPVSDIVLPVGISFYTFASLSYTIDVYRGRVRGDAPLLDYALFVSFFPHLVAGPIVRAAMLLPQFAIPRRASADQIGWGLALTCMGLFCKTVLADTVFAPIVDAVYADPAAHGAVDAWAAVFGFSGQIYYDFAGYSLCAIGLALCFGLEFPDNFRYPYAARSPVEFWRRWHISLSTWLRDYLYISLGGNRVGSARTTRNLLLTMLLGGLLHGASWMFVLWGGLHGLYLALARRWRDAPALAAQRDVLATVLTFILITLTWIPFRAPHPEVMTGIVAALLRAGGATHISLVSLAACAVTIVATLCWQIAFRDRPLAAQFAQLAPVARTGLLALCLIGIFLCSGGDARAFIYFQF